MVAPRHSALYGLNAFGGGVGCAFDTKHSHVLGRSMDKRGVGQITRERPASWPLMFAVFYTGEMAGHGLVGVE